MQVPHGERILSAAPTTLILHTVILAFGPYAVDCPDESNLMDASIDVPHERSPQSTTTDYRKTYPYSI